MSNNKSCPCHHLDEPCNPNCTCKNGFSSTGCYNCCTYGSPEQQKAMAEHHNQLRIDLEEKELFLDFFFQF